MVTFGHLKVGDSMWIWPTGGYYIREEKVQRTVRLPGGVINIGIGYSIRKFLALDEKAVSQMKDLGEGTVVVSTDREYLVHIAKDDLTGILRCITKPSGDAIKAGDFVFPVSIQPDIIQVTRVSQDFVYSRINPSHGLHRESVWTASDLPENKALLIAKRILRAIESDFRRL